MSRWWKIAIDVVYLIFETKVEELVCLVEDEHFDVARAEVTAADHVVYSARSTADYVLAVVEFADILTNTGTTDASVALDGEVVTESEDHGLDLCGQFTCRAESVIC